MFSPSRATARGQEPSGEMAQVLEGRPRILHFEIGIGVPSWSCKRDVSLLVQWDKTVVRY